MQTILLSLLTLYFLYNVFMLGMSYGSEMQFYGRNFYFKLLYAILILTLGGILVLIELLRDFIIEFVDYWSLKGWWNLYFNIDELIFTHKLLKQGNETFLNTEFKSKLKKCLDYQLLKRINKLNNYTHEPEEKT